MDLPGLAPKDLACLQRDSGEQLGGIVGIQSVKGAAQAINVEPGRRDPGPNKCPTGLLGKNYGTRYKRRLLNPISFKIIAIVAVPTLTCCYLFPAWVPK